MGTIGDIIKSQRQKLGMSQETLAQKVGVSRSAISRYESGDIGTMGIDKARLMAKALYLDPLVFINFYQKMDFDNADPIVMEETIPVPIYGRIAAGLPIEANQEIDGSIQVPRDRLHGGKFFGLRASGDSMYPRIEDGDALLFEKTTEYKSGDICAVYVNGYDATVKQVIKRDDQVVLQPVNPSYKATSYPQDEVEVVGVIKMIQRNF